MTDKTQITKVPAHFTRIRSKKDNVTLDDIGFNHGAIGKLASFTCPNEQKEEIVGLIGV